MYINFKLYYNAINNKLFYFAYRIVYFFESLNKLLNTFEPTNYSSETLILTRSGLSIPIVQVVSGIRLGSAPNLL